MFSYSIIGVIKTNDRLIMVYDDRMVFVSKASFLIQKVPQIQCSNSPVHCKLNRLNTHHLLNPYPCVLPCRNLACLECIYNHYNLFKRTFKCELCNQDHRLAQKLYQSISMNELLNKNVTSTLIDENEIVITNIGISLNS
jgi:hypothetical protein